MAVIVCHRKKSTDTQRDRLSLTHTHTQNKFALPGVYKLNCSDCNKFYIGQTGRSFKQRYIGHTKPLHSTTESTFANHLIEANNTYINIENNMDILHVHTKAENKTLLNN